MGIPMAGNPHSLAPILRSVDAVNEGGGEANGLFLRCPLTWLEFELPWEPCPVAVRRVHNQVAIDPEMLSIRTPVALEVQPQYP